MASIDIEVCDLIIRECFVYNVPKRVGAAKIFAEQWGLDKPLWTGECRVKSTDQQLFLDLVTKDGALFCRSAPIPLDTIDIQKPLTAFIEPAADSSRYFVVRFKDMKSRQEVMLGIGFRERNNAFDLMATVREKIKKTQQHNELDTLLESKRVSALNADNPSNPTETNGNRRQSIEDISKTTAAVTSNASLWSLVDSNPVDYSLKSPIRINLKGRGSTNTTACTTSSSQDRKPFNLIPPPKDGPDSSSSSTSSVSSSSSTNEDEWGDFSSATDIAPN